VKTAPIFQVYTVRKCRKRPIKTDIHSQRQLKIPKRSAVSAGKTTWSSIKSSPVIKSGSTQYATVWTLFIYRWLCNSCRS
jgi:hypothetical protein